MQDVPVGVVALRGLAVAAPRVVNVDVDTHGCCVGLVVKVGSVVDVAGAQRSSS